MTKAFKIKKFSLWAKFTFSDAKFGGKYSMCQHC